MSLSSVVGILGLEMAILEYRWGPPPDCTQVLVTQVTDLAEKAQVKGALVHLDDWLAWDASYGHDSSAQPHFKMLLYTLDADMEDP